jgi:hypothetical protein
VEINTLFVILCAALGASLHVQIDAHRDLSASLSLDV